MQQTTVMTPTQRQTPPVGNRDRRRRVGQSLPRGRRALQLGSRRERRSGTHAPGIHPVLLASRQLVSLKPSRTSGASDMSLRGLDGVAGGMLLGRGGKFNLELESQIGGGFEPPDRCIRGPQRRDFGAKRGPVYGGLTGVDQTVGDAIRAGVVQIRQHVVCNERRPSAKAVRPQCPDRQCKGRLGWVNWPVMPPCEAYRRQW